MNEPTTTDSSTNRAAVSVVKTALVMDDEAVLLLINTEFLERMRYVVAAASNGADAVDAMEERSYDLVLLDLRTPAKTGLRC